MTIETIIDYVFRSPFNINGNVLRQMLNKLLAEGADPEEIYGEILTQEFGTDEEESEEVGPKAGK